jgi:hypothetical protein
MRFEIVELRQIRVPRTPRFSLGEDVWRSFVFIELEGFLSESQSRVENKGVGEGRRGNGSDTTLPLLTTRVRRRLVQWRGNAKFGRRARQCRAPTTARGSLPSGADATLVQPCSTRFISYPFVRCIVPNLGWHIRAKISNGCWCKESNGGDHGQIELRSAARRIPAFASCSCTAGAAALW